MEKRLLLFFAVTFLIVSLWWRIFPPPEVAPPPLPEGGAPAETGSKTADVPPGAPEQFEADEEPPAVEEKPVEATAAAAEERVVIETEVYRLEFSNRGARLESAKLLHYKDGEGAPYELVDRIAAAHTGVYPLEAALESAALSEKLQEALFVVETRGPVAITGDGEAELWFRWSDGNGLKATKVLRFRGKDYTFDATISVERNGEEVAKAVLFGPGLGMEVAESRYVGVEKGVVVSRGEVALFAATDLEDAGTGVNVEATGVASHYFAALMLPQGEGLYGSRLVRRTVPAPEPQANGKAGATPKTHDVVIAALESPRNPAEFRLFLGPKQVELLESLRPGLSQIIEFGSWMRYPALLLRAGLVWLYDFVRNYGWAIVLLTVLINLALVPLKHYSFVSMRKMQKLAPQIQRIRERYKKVKPTDPRYQHMNQEIMTLYKDHKVSPVSGCLPMLLMIPFFFAFYRLLMASIELRQAPFVGWIVDLSQHDPYFVLPILMGASQVAIQKMTPQTSADPIQAKLMSFMPIVFTFILAWAPSGLVLYWFSNNLVSMGQQWATNRLLQSKEEEASGAARKATGKKSG